MQKWKDLLTLPIIKYTISHIEMRRVVHLSVWLTYYCSGTYTVPFNGLTYIKLDPLDFTFCHGEKTTYYSKAGPVH